MNNWLSELENRVVGYADIISNQEREARSPSSVFDKQRKNIVPEIKEMAKTHNLLMDKLRLQFEHQWDISVVFTERHTVDSEEVFHWKDFRGFIGLLKSNHEYPTRIVIDENYTDSGINDLSLVLNDSDMENGLRFTFLTTVTCLKK